MIEVEAQATLGAFQLDAAFRAPASGVTALFGRSGSGKTSLLRVVAGLLRPARGRVTVGDSRFLDTAAGVDLPMERRRVGYVFQDARLFPHLSVEGNLRYGLRRIGDAPIHSGFDAVVAMLDIAPLLARRPHHLSGGERQRVAIGRALLSQPRILLMDEPLAALDGARKAEILPYLERLRDSARLPILYVSHQVDEVARLADHMVVMDQGRVAAVGPIDQVMTRLDLRPLTGRYEAGAVLRCRVVGHDAAMALSILAFDGGTLMVPAVDLAVGAPLRARVRARDVMVATQPPVGLSALNILAARIAEIAPEPGAYAEVALQVGGSRLTARLTRASVARLDLVPGRAVYAVIKSVAVDRLGGG